MEDREVTVTQWDARRFLSPREFTDLENIYGLINQGRGLTPWAEWRYDRLLENVRQKKQKEYAETLVREYKEELKEDELRLEELSEGFSISDREEALEFFIKIKKTPNFEKILDGYDPANWLPKCSLKIREAAEGNVEGFFGYMMSEVKHPEAFGYEKKIWPIVVPNVNYIKIGVDSLEFCFKPYAVSMMKVHRAEHKKGFEGWVFTFPSSKEPVCVCIETLDPLLLNVTLPKITVPLRLLRGLASGDLQPDGCEVVKHKDAVLTYRVEGLDSEVVLPHDFLMFLMELGDDPLRALRDLGLLDEITLKILETKREEKPIEPPMVREKDRAYLRIIDETEGFLTFGGWGEALELTRDGAYRTLMRLEENGLVNTEKHESGEGTRASLTALGLAAIR